MPAGQSEFINSFICFAQESLNWCTKQSEDEVERIYNVLKSLIDDSRRRVHFDELSEKRFKGLIQSIHDGELSENLRNMQDILKNVGREDKELTDPIVEALQFQDRLRQKLENIGKMMTVWNDTRGRSTQPCMVSEEELLEFGKQLNSCATTPEERKTLKEHIPGLDTGPELKKSILF